MGCSNSNGLHNLQSAKCLQKPGLAKKFIFVPYFKADGTVNSIDLTATFGETEIQALINQADKNLRWYPSAPVSNFVTERADQNVETIDNINYPTSEGTRTLSCDFLPVSTILAKKLNSNNLIDVGLFIIDDENGLTGVKTDCNTLKPIKLERNQYGKVVFPTFSSVFKVSYMATWGQNVQDGDVVTLTYDDHKTDLLSLNGLVDVKACNVSATSTTTVEVSYAIENGSAKGIDFTGLLLADFTMTNKTTSLAVVPSAVVEVADGKYEFTFASQTTGDLGEITTVKAGYEFAVASFEFA